MTKAFTLWLWENLPSVNTPLGKSKLDLLNVALNEIDNRVIEHDTMKANQSDLLTALADVSYEESTGVLTFTKKNGATTKIDTKLEKLAVNFSYDSSKQRLAITQSDGTMQYVDMKALITELEFLDSNTVLFSVSDDGKVSADIVKGSITGDMIEPNYLAKVQLYADNAAESANNAKISEKNAREYAEQTKRLMVDTENRQKRNFGLVWIYYTYNLMNGFSDLETAAKTFAEHDMVVTQILGLNDLAPAIGESYATGYTPDSDALMVRAKELNPRLKRVEYIQSESERIDRTYDGKTAYLNPDGSWEGSTADLSGCTRIYNINQFRDWFKYFKSLGVDGVFFDDWDYNWQTEAICYQMGYDPGEFATFNEALNRKYADLIDCAHEEGLFVIINNGWNPNIGDWYTHFTEDDVICHESNIVSSDAGKILDGQNVLYDYYSKYYKTGKCKAKLWSQNYFPPDCTGNFMGKVNTYVINMALASGAQYVSVGVAYENALPDYVLSLAHGEPEIIRISDYIYRIRSNANTLEVYKDPLISGTLTENMINGCYSIYNGNAFRNAYTTAPYIERDLCTRVEDVEDTIANLTVDSKQNASSYWRMRIDDWQAASVYEAFTNFIEDVSTIATRYGDTQEFTVTHDAVGWHGASLLKIEFSDEKYTHLLGRTIEFGVMTIDISMVDGLAAPHKSMCVTTASNGIEYITLPDVGATSVLDDNIDGWCYTLTIPTDCQSVEILIWDYWIQASNAGTMHCERAYVIDVNELADEITKDWYTNLAVMDINNQNGGVCVSEKTYYRNKPLYDVDIFTTNAWGWAVHNFTADEVIALRGHTIEIGCFDSSVSDGSELGVALLNFGIAWSANDTSIRAVSQKLTAEHWGTSELWGEDVYFRRLTVPTDAVGLAIGLSSSGYAPLGSVVSLKGLYLYDLDEAGIVKRGDGSAKSSLGICRVIEEVEMADPSNLKNTLYVSDKGRMWMVDASGGRTNIADVQVAPTFTEGTHIGTIQVNGEAHELYAPGNLHHDGNSARIVIQETEPCDTAVLWVDTVNKLIKAYINGVWTQVN